LKKLLFSVVLFLFILYTHRENIKRMAQNEEEQV
jgi:glycerol-3-phosphate acyltransferase PlsY